MRPATRPNPARGGWRVEPRTGPLGRLSGADVVVLADTENLAGGARDLGFRVDPAALGQALDAACRHCRRHAFGSAAADRAAALTAEWGGWEFHLNPVEAVRTYRGTVRTTNCDALMLARAGVLLSRTKARVVVVASGDGELVTALARVVADAGTKRELMTLSLPGSTSYRLDARTNPLIAANLEVGRDVLLARKGV